MNALQVAMMLLVVGTPLCAETDAIPSAFCGTWKAHSVVVGEVVHRVDGEGGEERFAGAYQELIVTPDRIVYVQNPENARVYAPREFVVKDEKTIEFTADTPVDSGGEPFRGRLELSDGRLTLRFAKHSESGDSFADLSKTHAFVATRDD